MLYSSIALKSSRIVERIRGRTHDDDETCLHAIDELKRIDRDNYYKRVSRMHKQTFDCLLNMISATTATNGTPMANTGTGGGHDPSVYAFYNQESIIGLLACLAKQLDDDLTSVGSSASASADGDTAVTSSGAIDSQNSNAADNDDDDEAPPTALFLVKFVLAMLKNTAEIFEGDVCVMLVNVLGVLLLKCEPTECDRIASELDVNDDDDDKSSNSIDQKVRLQLFTYF